MTQHANENKKLSIKNLLECTRRDFDRINGKEKHKDSSSTSDCLMSALAMFSLKMPSLLHFDHHREDEIISHNLNTLYGVQNPPSDTYMRERLDPLDPQELRTAFRSLFRQLQRGKVLEDYVFMNGRYLMPLDGTGVFSSHTVHCRNCCEKHHKDGSITYHHQVLSAVLVHPDHKEVFPLCPEPIIKQDGNKKNDCESNACHRLLEDFKREHPHLKVIVTGDAIHTTGPRIRQLKKDDMGFVLVVKPGSHDFLFDWVAGLTMQAYEIVVDGIAYTFRWANQVPLNDANHDLLVNFLDCVVDDPKSGTKHFSWVTDITIKTENAFQIARGGRAKWKIENETFNTLKNQGYNFEHNYGHGKENLSTVLTFLMMLAFFIDQIQQRACGMFQAALKRAKQKKMLWEKMRSLFVGYFISSWDDLFYTIETGKGRAYLSSRPP